MTEQVRKTVENRRVGDGTPGPGRPKGCRNRLTVAAKEAFQLAFEGIGGAAKLQEWANENPTEFFKLFARLIPMEQHTDLVMQSDPMDEAAITERIEQFLAQGQSNGAAREPSGDDALH